MTSNMPDGFIDLIRLVMKENPSTKKSIPSDKQDIWDDLIWHIFLSDNRTESQVNYIFGELSESEILDMKNIEDANEVELKARMIQFIKKIMNNKSNDKRVNALKSVLSNIDRLVESIISAKIFFREHNVCKKYLENKASDSKTTKNFVAEISYSGIMKENPMKITGIGPVNAILWLNRYGKALDQCPPSRQVMHFVNDDLEHKTFDYRKKYDEDEKEDDKRRAALTIEKLTNEHISKAIQNVTVSDVQQAIWHYKSAQNLLHSSESKKLLTPQKLLDYLKYKDKNLSKFGDELTNIDKEDDLAEDLKEFLA